MKIPAQYPTTQKQPGKQVIFRMSTNMVHQIREAEEQAEEFLSEARIHSKKILSDAQTQAQLTKEKLLAEAKANAQKIVDEAAEEAAHEIGKLREEYLEQVSQMQKSADQNRQKAVNAVIERIVKANGNR